MKRLNELIKTNLNINITGIEDNSLNVKKGYIFVATKGYFINHEDFIDDAIKKGASFIVCSKNYKKKITIPYKKVNNTNKYLIKLLNKYYDYPFKNIKIIGITGTDGKTSSAILASKLLKSGYIGTNGALYNYHRFHTDNTTPCPVSLFKICNKLRNLGCRCIVMEISSEALFHERCNFFKLDIACLTNITEDHLNIHKTIYNYVNSKLKMFKMLKSDGYSILNCNSKYFKYFKDNSKNVITYGNKSFCDFYINRINKDFNFYVNNIYLENNFLFNYNIYNITLSYAIAKVCNVSDEIIIKRLKKIKKIDGRCELLNYSNKYKIIIDYAHTLNGIKNIVTNCNKLGRVICVTGCAGGREKEKRKYIGKYLLLNTYLSIFTMDDPRYEDVNNIIDDMLSITNKKNYLRIIDRKEAINKALDLGSNNDIILILGKGRDNYMAINDKKIKYSDIDVIRRYFKLDIK